MAAKLKVLIEVEANSAEEATKKAQCLQALGKKLSERELSALLKATNNPITFNAAKKFLGL